MMEHPNTCVVCSPPIHPTTKGHLCAEHEAWHNGWFHVPKMEQLRMDVWNNVRSDWHFGIQSHLMMLRENDRIIGGSLQKVRYSLWVVVYDMERRARLWLDGGNQGWADDEGRRGAA